MYRIDDPTAATSLPTPESAGTEGYFTEGNPATGTPATRVRGSWLNMLQEELRAVVVAGGLTPSKTVFTQVRDALLALFAKVNGDATKTFLVAPATASNQAVQFGQVSGVVGQARNLQINASAIASNVLVTADEIVVETALGGLRYCLPSFSKSVTLTTTGAGGMDTGAAPASGYVALYAIYNPTTQTAAVLATNASSAAVPNIYSAGHMPTGYTASALISVWPTNSSSLFMVGDQLGRRIGIADITGLSTASVVGTPQALSIAGIVPPNAKFISGSLFASATGSTSLGFSLFDSDSVVGGQEILISGSGLRVPFARIAMITPQQVRWSSSNTTGTSPVFGFVVSSYEI